MWDEHQVTSIVSNHWRLRRMSGLAEKQIQYGECLKILGVSPHIHISNSDLAFLVYIISFRVKLSYPRKFRL